MPKLDNGTEIYTDKIRALIEVAQINTLTVVLWKYPVAMGCFHLHLKHVIQLKSGAGKVITIGIEVILLMKVDVRRQ
jgi:hypothetical protein